MAQPQPEPRRPSLGQITALFFRVGNTTFGGGDPTIATLQREFDVRHWITPEQFAMACGLARITPGTNILAFCAASGWMLLGIAGALAAVLAVTVPSAVLVIWLTRVCELGNTNRWAHAAIAGTVSAAVGTMIAASLNLIRLQFTPSSWLRIAIVVIGAFILARVFALSPIQILGLAALLGALWTRQ